MLQKIISTPLLLLSFTPIANASIVEFITSQGTIEVNLFDQTTPKTVENFLTYLSDGHYTNSVIHRVAPGFVVQGGGFEFSGGWPLSRNSANAAVINEPVYSNVKGTIAMAKVGGNPDSATDQWFFNLKDNNTGTAEQGNLDLQNSGFTVFGQVIGDGMAIVEKIAQLKLCNDGNLQGIPMVIDDAQACSDLTTPGIENFVVIENVIIIDNSEVTDADLNPVKNTQVTKADNSSGGSVAWLSMLALTLLSIKRITLRNKK